MQTGFPGFCYEEMMESAFARKVKRNKDVAKRRKGQRHCNRKVEDNIIKEIRTRKGDRRNNDISKRQNKQQHSKNM
jgi:hypothetical protein